METFRITIDREGMLWGEDEACPVLEDIYYRILHNEWALDDIPQSGNIFGMSTLARAFHFLHISVIELMDEYADS
jgi:hypothetical protein